MAYQALYRKFRPGEFDEVKGQEHIVTTLRNQIKAGRIGHAYLFCGTRGTGKTTVAKILAKAVNCLHPVNGSPCNECESCKKINEKISMNVIEIDAASNTGVANVRDIIDELQYSPAEGKYKVYIIDEVHMLSSGAFNALLKTLEEPPSYVIFILATTEPHRIPVTIHSRCQRYDFRRITIDTIADRLRELAGREQVAVEEKALRYVARVADGSMRDALSLLDRCIAFYLDEEITYERALEVLGAVDTAVYSSMFRFVLKKSVRDCMVLLDEMLVQGRDISQFVSEFIWYLRGLMLLCASEQGGELLDVSKEQLVFMMEEAHQTSVEELMRMIRVLSDMLNQLRYASGKRVLVEIALIRLCMPQMDNRNGMEELSARIRSLERKLEQGVPVAASSAMELSAAETHTVRETSESPESGGQKEKLPKALPEDIKQVLFGWNEILHAYGSPGNIYLSYAKRLVSEEGALVLQFTQQNDEAFFVMNDAAELSNLKQVIENIIGKEITIETKVVEECVDRQSDDIMQFIHFDGVEIKD